MDSGTDIPFDESNRQFLGQFRHTAAGFVKHLILARGKKQPKFLAREIRQQWTLDEFAFETVSCEYLLRLARERLGVLLEDYVGYRDSIRAPQSDEDLQIEKLRENLAMFVDPDDLDAAIKQERRNAPIDWERVVHWELLPEIREGLDMLPEPSAVAPRSQECSQWSRPHGPKNWAKVFGVSYDTMKAMLDGGKVRNRKVSPRRYRICMEDLPPNAR